jgi:hypothetical protein
LLINKVSSASFVNALFVYAKTNVRFRAALGHLSLDAGEF